MSLVAMRIRVFFLIAWTVIHYTLRDRVAAFFIFLLPFAIIGLVGTVLSAGAGHPLGVVSYDRGPLGQRLVTQLASDQALSVHQYSTLAQLDTAVREQQVSAGLAIPANLDAALAGRGTAYPVFIVEREELVPSALRLAVYRALNTITATGLAARYDAQLGHLPAAAARRRAAAAATAEIPAVRVQQVTQPTASALTGVDYSAPGNLVLFVFLNIVGSSSGLVAVRQFGVTRRMLSTATGGWTIALAEGAGRVVLGMMQALVIIGVGALAFHVRWGPIGAVLAVVFLAAAISAALALLLSAFASSPEQAFVLGPAVMLTAAMLGGCLWPLAFVPGPLRLVGRVFPLSWAMDALLRLGVAGSTTGDILIDLAVLAAFAVAATLIAVPAYRRKIAQV
jgi:ABC-2 type transport system permease protein